MSTVRVLALDSEKYEEYESTVNSTSTSTSTSTTKALTPEEIIEAARKDTADEMESRNEKRKKILAKSDAEIERDVNLAFEYAKRAGLTDSESMRAYIWRLLRMIGMETAVIIEVLDETMLAPRPSWRYFCAIAKRLVQEDCLLMIEWVERQDKWEQRGH